MSVFAKILNDVYHENKVHVSKSKEKLLKKNEFKTYFQKILSYNHNIDETLYAYQELFQILANNTYNVTKKQIQNRTLRL